MARERERGTRMDWRGYVAPYASLAVSKGRFKLVFPEAPRSPGGSSQTIGAGARLCVSPVEHFVFVVLVCE